MAGDYYRAGDPIFGSIFRGIKGAVSGFVSGGPLGAITGGIRGVTSRQGLPMQKARAPILRMPSPRPVPGFRGFAQRAIPGGATGFMAPSGGCCPPGYHLDKQTGSSCVKNRSMNPGNAKALRRALRRQTAFVSLAKRALKGSGYKIARS